MTHLDDIHRAIDQIATGWAHALRDIQPLGLKAHTYDGITVAHSGHADPTGEQATRTGHAAAYIAQLHDVTAIFLETPPHTPQRLAEALHGLFDHIPTGWAPNALQRLYELANAAIRWWPDEAQTGQTINGITVGARTNEIEICGLCGDPVPPGRNLAGQMTLRRIDGQAFHAAGNGCYWTVWRQRRVGA